MALLLQKWKYIILKDDSNGGVIITFDHMKYHERLQVIWVCLVYKQ